MTDYEASFQRDMLIPKIIETCRDYQDNLHFVKIDCDWRFNCLGKEISIGDVRILK